MIVAIITGTVAILALVLACVVRSRSYAAGGAGATAVNGLVSIRLVDDVQAPDGISIAANAIDRVLSARFPYWFDRVELVIEWVPFGYVIRGPFIATGFEDRATGVAVMLPDPPITDATARLVARVVGTIRIERQWPWSTRQRCIVVIMDGRLGATPREVLAGDDTAGRPRASVEHTALFYEVANRVVPMGILGVHAQDIALQALRWRELELAMLATFAKGDM